MQQNEASGLKIGLLEEFMDVTFGFSEEELQAVHGIIPMTQEIFERCVRKCEDLGAVRQLGELIGTFPELQSKYRERQRLPEGPEDNSESIWQEGKAVRGLPQEELKVDRSTVQELSKEKQQVDELWKKINSQLEKMK